MTTEFRIEADSMGEVKVPANALYQAQTQRAVDNFAFSKHSMPTGLFKHSLTSNKPQRLPMLNLAC